MSLLGRLRARIGDGVFVSARQRRRVAVHLLVLAVALVAVAVLVRRHFAFLTDAAAVRAFVAQYGVWAPVVLIALQTLQVVAAPVPGQVLAVVAGYLFGPWWGTLYNVIGITVGSTIAFWLSRRFGRAYVETVVRDDVMAAFDAMSDEYARPAIFLFFLVPGLPDDLICFVAGLTDVPLWQLVVLAVVGRTPAFFLANVLGDFLGTDRYVAAVVVAVVLLAGSLLGYLARDRLAGLFRSDS